MKSFNCFKKGSQITPCTKHDKDELEKKKDGHYEAVLLPHRYKRQLDTYWAFITYLWQYYERQFKSVDQFRYYTYQEIGYGEMRFINVGGEKLAVFIPGSISFMNCTQKKFNEVFELTKKLAFDKHGVSFDAWLEHEEENKCENPYCNRQKMGGKHEIFPGRDRRDACIHYGFQVECCYDCHLRSHGTNVPRNIVGYEMIYMAKLWCDVRKINYDKSLALVNAIRNKQ